MATPKSKSQLKRISAQKGESVWKHSTEPAPDTVIHKWEKQIKSGAKVEIARLFDGTIGLGFFRKDGAAEIRTRFACSTDAMDALMEGYQAIKDRPIAFKMAYEVYRAKKSKKKKK